MLARSFGIAVALLSLVGTAAAQPKPLRLDLNIPANQLVVYEGDRVLRTYRVSVGLPGHDTPTGSYSVSRAEWNPWWRPPAREWAKDDKITPPGPDNPMGRVKLFFAPLYFIHGTPDKENIGSPASHGCVRMLNSDVVALARLIHQRVAPQVTDKQIDRILASGRQTRHVGFQRTIPLTIRYEPIVVESGELRVFPDFYNYGAIHAEGVYQALIAAGYDVRTVDPAEVRRLLDRARKSKTVVSMRVKDVGAELAATRPAGSPQAQ